MRASLSFALLAALSTVNADLHHLIVGTFGTENLYTLEFDDSALTLNLIGNLSVPDASSWLALSVRIPIKCLKSSNNGFSMTRKISTGQLILLHHQRS